MRKLYQAEWLGIPFKSFTKISSGRLADTKFYKAFYRAFFEKYRDFSGLDTEWVKLKLQVAGFLNERIKSDKNIEVLSVGCGIGVIEKALIEEGARNLEITEISAEPLIWLKHSIDPEKIHIGCFPECLKHSRTYKLIYLSSVDHCFNRPEFISLLKDVRSRLSEGGKCILISWAFESLGPFQRAVVLFKDTIKYGLERLRIRHRGQFWGYLRNRNDFRDAMRAAGFIEIKDRFLEKKTRWDTYWIEALK